MKQKRWLEEYLTIVDSYVTHHEIDYGGRLQPEEAVAYRMISRNAARPYLSHLSAIIDGSDYGNCQAIAKAGETAVKDRVVGPLFGPYYGYTQVGEGDWRK